MNKYINFVLTADKNYVKIIGITIFSILKNISNHKIPRFFLFSQNFSKDDINEINKLKAIYNCEIVNVPMERYLNLFSFVDITKFKNNYISLACYFRLLMFKILPEDVQECFYVDGDMIVDYDLSQISLPQGKLLAAVIDISAMQFRENILDHCYKISDFEKFQKDPLKYPYFNAGFFLADIKKSKELKIFEQAMDFLNRNPNPPYADQDTLNAIFGQKYSEYIEFLPPEYNLYSEINYDKKYDRMPYDKKLIRFAANSPKIYHFAGKYKPWQTSNIKNFYSKWWEYYKLSPWGKDIILKQLMINLKPKRKNIISLRFSKNKSYIKLFNKYLYHKEFKNYLVSIIITSYNYGQYIEQTLNSILEQEYCNYEVIIVDDGSKDNSLDIIKKYTDKFPNFKLYTHENHENKGLIESLKLAITKVKGEYTAFIESDDFWAKNYLQEKINFINKNKHNFIVINDIQTLGEKRCDKYVCNQASFFRKKGNKNNLFKYFNKDNAIPTFSEVMLKTDLLKKLDFNTPIAAWLDFWLWRQVALLYPIGYIDKKLTFWRIHNNSFVLQEFDKNNANKKYFKNLSNKLLSKKHPFIYFYRKVLKL